MRACVTKDFSWYAARTGYHAAPAGAVGIAALDAKGVIRGMVICDEWTPRAVRLHFSLDTPVAGRCLLPATFEFVFGRERRDTAWSLISEGNPRAIRTAEHLGFRRFGAIHNGWSEGSDLTFLQLRRDNCRFLRAPKGKHVH